VEPCPATLVVAAPAPPPETVLAPVIVVVLAHLSMTGARWAGPAAAAATAAIAVVVAGQAWTMVARGPAPRLGVPPGWALERDDAPGPGGAQALEQRDGADAERLDDGGCAVGVAR
jgi:hypothetical protein